jgi:hypothetical protein
LVEEIVDGIVDGQRGEVKRSVWRVRGLFRVAARFAKLA